MISDDYIAGSTISSYSKEANHTGKLMITAPLGLRFPFCVSLTETQSLKNDPDKKWCMERSTLVLNVLHGSLCESDFSTINHSVLNVIFFSLIQGFSSRAVSGGQSARPTISVTR